MIRRTVSVGVYLLALSFFCACGCIAQETSSEITSTGTITYIDLEGGFYGFIASDGTQYLPLDLPDEFKQDGLVVDITGIKETDVVTIQMWGQPLRILSISKHEGFTPSENWYEGEEVDRGPEEQLEMTTLLLKSSTALSQALGDMDMQLAHHAADLKGKNLQSTDLQSFLKQVAESNPALSIVSILDRSGTIIAVYPDTYAGYIGTNVRDQALVSSVIRDPVPGMSEYIKSAEGEYAINIIYPVYSSSLSVTGYLSVLLNPALLIQSSVQSLVQEGRNILVTQPDGSLLGQVLTAPGAIRQNQYEKIQINEIAASPVSSYPAGYDMLQLSEAVSSGEERHQVFWNTVSLHSTPWRVLVF
ncbi:cache domain-containing protein [Methanospirillum sp.]|uniref:cache domain-containing protein n=2 Tax=Methanospirillum sp. TaxID=45200 RepID=UPI002C1E5492|nr:cache domain-containing protein [Methanospirillum sp.]HOL40320.1 cache domain-containing protein [Methanospirillum sp.]HPP78851.1 cache domain-containing protein [Methanospirillum sp.]